MEVNFHRTNRAKQEVCYCLVPKVNRRYSVSIFVSFLFSMADADKHLKEGDIFLASLSE